MLNIIICENNKNYKLRTYDIINQYMMKTNIKYKIKTYENYNTSLKQFIKKPNDGHNIYILDIELDNDDSGIDIANDIRTHDYDSIIILETGYTELMSEAQKLRLNILDYVYKTINYDKNMLELIELSLDIFNLKKTIKFRIDKIDYNIKYEDVYYIETDSLERICIVHTNNEKYEVKKPLNYFEKQINSYFCKINRGCIVNTLNIFKCDYDKNIIKFNNNEIIKGMISTRNMKGLKEHVGNN